MKLKILLSFVVLATSSVAFAKKKVVYRKTQEVNFAERGIDGDARTPDGSYLHQKRGVDMLPLYKVRKNFDKAILDSVDYLR